MCELNFDSIVSDEFDFLSLEERTSEDYMDIILLLFRSQHEDEDEKQCCWLVFSVPGYFFMRRLSQKEKLGSNLG